MSPKSLSQLQKENQRQHLLQKGKEVIMQYGFKKASIDDFCKAAGIAKGTFYLYFKSKEDFLTRLIIDLSQNYFVFAQKTLMDEENIGLKLCLKKLLTIIFSLPEFLFLFREHRELQELMTLLLKGDFAKMEKEWFYELFAFCKVDTNVISVEVVHNYLHAIYLAKTADIMIDEYVEQTADLMIDFIVDYILSGRKED